MREVIHEIETWRNQGKHIGIATNVKRAGMSLRPLGAKMAMTTELEIAGSVTGGCIEGAVYEEAQDVIRSQQPRLLHYGVTGDQKPWDIGLTCGSSLDVFVESMESPIWEDLYPFISTTLEQNQLAAVTTLLSGPGIGKKLMIWPDGRSRGDLGNSYLNEETKKWAGNQMSIQETTWTNFPATEGCPEVFVDVLEPKPRLIIIGASHLAIPLVSLARVMGYQTIVIDPRETFANSERFPEADKLIVEWPSTALEKMTLDESCYIAVISHDDKLDNPALAVALTHNPRYVGVLGTRKRVPQRIEELKKMGVSDDQLKHLRAPIGIPLGATLTEEIALSILSEMVAARRGITRVD